MGPRTCVAPAVWLAVVILFFGCASKSTKQTVAEGDAQAQFNLGMA